MDNLNLENAEITGIEHKQRSQELLMILKLHSGEICQIGFQTVVWWELCSFGTHNVLFSIDHYDGDSLPEAVINDQDIPEQYVQLVNEQSCKLFVLNASVGLAGWIVAGHMN